MMYDYIDEQDRDEDMPEVEVEEYNDLPWQAGICMQLIHAQHVMGHDMPALLMKAATDALGAALTAWKVETLNNTNWTKGNGPI